jgi:hypothetical protein
MTWMHCQFDYACLLVNPSKDISEKENCSAYTLDSNCCYLLLTKFTDNINNKEKQELWTTEHNETIHVLSIVTCMTSKSYWFKA